MFLLYHSDRCSTSETVFHWCYVNDLHTTHTVVCWVTTVSNIFSYLRVVVFVYGPILVRFSKVFMLTRICQSHWFVYSLVSSYFVHLIYNCLSWMSFGTRETLPDFSRGFVYTLPSELGLITMGKPNSHPPLETFGMHIQPKVG
jgi:hypothetical protein